MKTIESIQANNYLVHFNQNGYDKLNIHLKENKYSNLFIIVDNETKEHCLPKFLPLLETDLNIEVIEFKSGEVNKNLVTCIDVWNVLTELGADRKSLIINLGGGVVTDLGGFVASTFKRGVDFINIPTTLLAMTDASVGGKTGVDLGNLKNQIGVINVPQMVIIDTNYLTTLSDSNKRSGLAEMLKHGLIYDAAYWKNLLNINYNYDELIHRSVEIKNDIVMQDPTENNIRKALNFGHTLGHAIESYFLESEDKTTLLHGEAIAIGMILESYISLHKNLISADEYVEIKTALKLIYDDVLIDESEIEPILEFLIHDKKNEYGSIQFALIEGIGKMKINQSVETKLILDAFNDYKL